MTAVPPPVPGIDPAEALIFVAGLEPFLRHTSRDLGSAIVRSETLPDAIEAKIHLFLGRTERAPAPDLPAVDFREVVDLLDTPPAPGDIGKTMGAFGGNHTLALDVGQQVTRMATYLRQQIPRPKHIGLTGPEDLPPPRSEEFRFRRCWRAAVDPGSLFDDLQAFAVSREQVKCFTALFPTIARELWPTIKRTLVRKRTQSQTWRPSRRQEVTLRVLGAQEGPMLVLGNALVPIFAQEAAQQAAQQQTQQQKAAAVPSQADESTPTGRLDAAG